MVQSPRKKYHGDGEFDTFPTHKHRPQILRAMFVCINSACKWDRSFFSLQMKDDIHDLHDIRHADVTVLIHVRRSQWDALGVAKDIIDKVHDIGHVYLAVVVDITSDARHLHDVPEEFPVVGGHVSVAAAFGHIQRGIGVVGECVVVDG